MPKRSNPFGDHSSLQLKTHVRTKEVDNGICQQARMQSVYERTQKLLFSGMRQNPEEKGMAVDNNDNLAIGQFSMESQAQTDQTPYRQMTLGKNCELLPFSSDDLMDIETDSSSLSSLKVPSMSNADHQAECQDKCESSWPAFALVRNTGEYSPNATTPLSSETLYQASESPLHKTSNIFQQMKMAQLKNSLRTESVVIGGACHNCRQPVEARNVMKCQFCENYVCGPCVRQCGKCYLHFCQLCSILNYNQTSERSFCLTCSGR